MKHLFFLLGGRNLVALSVMIVGATAAQAITVQELQINPTKVVNITTMIYPSGGGSAYLWTGNVYAGVNRLLVDGTPMDGFCIDPFHFSLPSSTGYSFVPLSSTGKTPGAMTAAAVTLVERLWGSYYTASLTDAATAAGLQIAIWRAVGGGAGFVLNDSNDYGASVFLAHVTNTSSYTYSGPVAHLIALTGPGQDYVVQLVPDAGATASLLGVAFILVALLRWSNRRRATL